MLPVYIWLGLYFGVVIIPLLLFYPWFDNSPGDSQLAVLFFFPLILFGVVYCIHVIITALRSYKLGLATPTVLHNLILILIITTVLVIGISTLYVSTRTSSTNALSSEDQNILNTDAQARLEQSATWLATHGPLTLEEGGDQTLTTTLAKNFGVVPSFKTIVDNPLHGRYKFSPKTGGITAFVSLIHEDKGVQFWHMVMEPSRRNVEINDRSCLSIITIPQDGGVPARIAEINHNLAMSYPSPNGGLAHLPEDDPLVAWRLRGWEHPTCVAGTSYEGREAAADHENGTARFLE